MNDQSMNYLPLVIKFSVDLLQRPISPEMVIFYITQDTQRHALLPELKSGMFEILFSHVPLQSPKEKKCALASWLLWVHSIYFSFFGDKQPLLFIPPLKISKSAILIYHCVMWPSTTEVYTYIETLCVKLLNFFCMQSLIWRSNYCNLQTSITSVSWLMQRYCCIGGFRVTGKVCTQCSLSDPISGELTVEASAVPVHSIDLHLFRVESILAGEKIAAETTLIHTTQASNTENASEYFKLGSIWILLLLHFFLLILQIADGDICRNFTVPIHVILPRLLTCPTILAGFVLHPLLCFMNIFHMKLLLLCLTRQCASDVTWWS